jgi:hypothetical protein
MAINVLVNSLLTGIFVHTWHEICKFETINRFFPETIILNLVLYMRKLLYIHLLALLVSFISIVGVSAQAVTSIREIQQRRSPTDEKSMLDGQTVTVNGVVYTAPNLHYQYNNTRRQCSFWIKERSTHGIQVRLNDLTNTAGRSLENIKVGDLVEITATVGEFNGDIQLIPDPNIAFRVISQNNPIGFPVLITPGSLNDPINVALENGEIYQGRYSVLQNVQVISVDTRPGRNTFVVADEMGNQTTIWDACIDMRNATSGFFKPNVGDVFEDIAGALVHLKSGPTNQYQLFPFDPTRYILKDSVQPGAFRIHVAQLFKSANNRFSPLGDVVLEQVVRMGYPVIPVAIHINDSLQLANNNILRTQFGIDPAAIPQVVFNQDRMAGRTSYGIGRDDWQETLDSLSMTDAVVAVNTDGYAYDPNTRQLKMSVSAEFVRNMTGDFRFNGYLIERSVLRRGSGFDQANHYDNIPGYPELNGKGNPIVGYQHKFVLRQYFNGPFGLSGVIPSTIMSGDRVSTEITIDIPANLNVDSLVFMPFVQRFSENPMDREILNAAFPMPVFVRDCQMTANASGTRPTRVSLRNGRIDVTVQNGTPPYLFSLNFQDPSRDSVFRNLAPGQYIVLVTDAQNCEAFIEVDLTMDTANCNLRVTHSATRPSTGVNDGAITLTPSNGTTPYVYTLLGNEPKTNNRFENLGEGFYLFSIIDDLGCETIYNVELLPCPTFNSDNLRVTDADEPNSSNGVITVSRRPSGGNPDAQYEYSLNRGPFSGAVSFTGLRPGDYEICMREARTNECSTCVSVSVGFRNDPCQFPAPVIEVEGGQISRCIGIDPDEYNLRITNPDTRYQYVWFANGAPTRVTGPNASITVQAFPDSIRLSLQVNITGCANRQMSNTIVLRAFPRPVAQAGNDVLICPGQTSPALGNVSNPRFQYRWVPGTGLNDSTIARPTSRAARTTRYVLTVSGTGCPSATDTVTVNVSGDFPVPILEAENRGRICTGSALSLSIQNFSPNLDYSWFRGRDRVSGIDQATLSVFQPGNYVIRAIEKDNRCPNASTRSSDSVAVVSIGLAPRVTIGPDQTVCQNANANLTGTLTRGNAISVSWTPTLGLSSSSTLATVATPGTTTNYTIQVTDSIGCIGRDTVRIVVNPLPRVNAGPDQTICNGASARLQASGGTRYSWSPPSGLNATNIPNPTANPERTTSYTVTATDANNCQASDEITITVDPFIAYGGGNAQVCVGGTVQLQATGGDTYRWTPATGLSNVNIANPIAAPTNTTTYTVSITRAGTSCTAREEVVVRVVPRPTAAAGPDLNVCRGDSVQLRGTSNGTTISWTPAALASRPGSLSTSAAIAQTTTFKLTATNREGCTASDSLIARIVELPLVQAGPDVTVCPSALTQLNASGATRYEWSPTRGLSDPNIATPSFRPLTATTYTLIGFNAQGCKGTDAVKIDLFPRPTISAGPDKFICSNAESVQLEGSGAEQYSWEPTFSLNIPDAPDPIAQPIASTTYTLTATDRNGCQAQDQVSVLVYNITADITMESCVGGIPRLKGTGGFRYTWSPTLGVSNPTSSLTRINPIRTTTYTLTTASEDGNCIARDTITLYNFSVNAGTDQTVCWGTPVQLNLTTNAINSKVSWSPNRWLTDDSIVNPITEPRSNVTYVATVTDVNGCQKSDNVRITLFASLSPTIELVSFRNTTCAGCQDGFISVQGTGGVPPYRFSINGGPSQSSGIFRRLLAGTYIITLTDNNGCGRSLTQEILDNPVPTVCEVPTGVNVSQLRKTEASVTWISVPGAREYIVEFKPTTATTFERQVTTNTFIRLSGLEPETQYDFRVLAKCSDTLISAPSETKTGTTTVRCDGRVTTRATLASCPTCADASVTVAVNGGRRPFSYSIDGNLFQPEEVFNNVLPGNYEVTVTDSFACVYKATTTVGFRDPNNTCITPSITGVVPETDNATVSWTPVGEARFYEIHVVQNLGTVPYTLLERIQDPAQTSTVVRRLYKGYGFSVRIRARCQKDFSEWSEWQRFATRPAREGENTDAASSEFALYPNPNDGNFEVSMYLHEDQLVSLNILDIAGKTVYQTAQQHAAGNVRLDIHQPDLSTGVYILEIRSAGITRHVRFNKL